MKTDVIYCPQCGRCCHLADTSALGCGHRIKSTERIKIRSQRIGPYEIVSMRKCDRFLLSFFIWPDGFVERSGRIHSPDDWLAYLAGRHPLYPEAFLRRWDIDSRRLPPYDEDPAVPL